jgi:hypothetical protein
MNPTTQKTINLTLTAILVVLIAGNIVLAVWQTHLHTQVTVSFGAPLVEQKEKVIVTETIDPRQLGEPVETSGMFIELPPKPKEKPAVPSKKSNN